MKQKLKPCPFCGEQPMVSKKTLSVYCKNALCPQIIANESDNLTDAIQGWNTRCDHIPDVTKKVDHITTDNSKVNINLLEENERLKNEVADLKEALGLAHTLEAREEIDWEQKYNRLKDDYNILQAQYKMALEGVASNSSFSKSTEIDFGQRAHELQIALINQGITEVYEIERKVEEIIDYQCAKSGDDRFNQLKQQKNEED